MAQVAAPQVHGAAVYADDLGAGGRRYVRVKQRHGSPRFQAFSPLYFMVLRFHFSRMPIKRRK